MRIVPAEHMNQSNLCFAKKLHDEALHMQLLRAHHAAANGTDLNYSHKQ